MEPEILEMIVKYKRLNQELDEAGGPGKNGGLFEEIISLEEDILAALGLPPAQSFISLLHGDDVDEILEALETSAREYEERPIKEPALILAEAALRGEGDPFDLLPMAGFCVHDYQIFMFERKLLGESSIERIDATIAEMKAAEKHLNDLGILGVQGIKKNPELYRMLINDGMHSLDEYLMINNVFDIGECDMDSWQFYIRGLINAKNNRLAEAVFDLSMAAERMDGFCEIFYNRGLALEMLGEFDRAMEDYSQALTCFSGDYRSLCNRGLLLARKGRLDEAMKDFNRAIEVNPHSYYAYCNRGNLHDMMDDLDCAIEDFSIAIALAPGESSLYCNRGISYFRMGRRERALEDLKKSAGMGDETAHRALKELFGEN